MVVDFAATRPHYADHLRVIHDRLPAEHRGLFVARGGTGSFRQLRQRRGVPLVVASHRDLMSSIDGVRPVVLIEHGAGQSYGGDPDPRVARHRCYAGGTGRHRAAAFLHPNEHAAARDRAAYPEARVEVVGPLRHARLAEIPRRDPGGRPVVAFTFHWECSMCPETRSSWPWSLPAVEAAVASGEFDDVVVTAHPRIWRTVAPAAARVGATLAESFETVLSSADVLVGDNTTAMYDWAALRGPSVVLNAPWYRRGVEHGLRFWSGAGIGPQVDDPAAVVDAALRAVEGPWPGAEEAVGEAWAPVADPVGAAVETVLEVAASAGA